MKKISTIVLVFFISPQLYAETGEDLVKSILSISQTRQQFSALVENAPQQFAADMVASSNSKISEEKLKKYKENVHQVASKHYSWSNIEPKLVNAYLNTFSEVELEIFLLQIQGKALTEDQEKRLPSVIQKMHTLQTNVAAALNPVHQAAMAESMGETNRIFQQ